uniref:Potassium channel blocker AbTx20 n=1 Tax=Androctonus bicolor TaxID=748906 RepID=A0A0K0LBW6_9SCOR|nr:potassium channel blocker AbTx20 [Androctonus bicolor]
MNRIGKITVMLLALISIIAIISETKVEASGCNPLYCIKWCHNEYKKFGECRDKCVCTERDSIFIKKPKNKQTKQLIR